VGEPVIDDVTSAQAPAPALLIARTFNVIVDVRIPVQV
jgi:hypothetical protein